MNRSWNLQTWTALIAGAALAVLGVFGLFSGSTVLGIGVNATQSWLDLLIGAAGIAAATVGYARLYNQLLGAALLIAGFSGLIAPAATTTFLGVNAATTVLHLLAGAVISAVGFALGGGEQRRSAT